MSSMAPWTCDTCNKPITTVEDGWVEWLKRPNGEDHWTSHSLRLVHRFTASPLQPSGNCQHDEDMWFKRDQSIVGDSDLERFLGPDGLMRLLEFAAERDFELDDLIEFIKRLHIPGYEQARKRFGAAISAGVFEPNTSAGFYDQDDIKATLNWIAEQKKAP